MKALQRTVPIAITSLPGQRTNRIRNQKARSRCQSAGAADRRRGPAAPGFPDPARRRSADPGSPSLSCPKDKEKNTQLVSLLRRMRALLSGSWPLSRRVGIADAITPGDSPRTPADTELRPSSPPFAEQVEGVAARTGAQQSPLQIMARTGQPARERMVRRGQEMVGGRESAGTSESTTPSARRAFTYLSLDPSLRWPTSAAPRWSAAAGPGCG
jgi:hypothetical protein